MGIQNKELAYGKLVAQWVRENKPSGTVLVPDLFKGYGYRTDPNDPQRGIPLDTGAGKK